MSDAEVKEQLLNWRRLVAKWDRWTNRKKGRMGMGLKADLTGGKTTKGWAIECRHTEGIGKTDYHDCKKGWKRMYQENCSTVWTVGIWVYWVPQPHILVCWAGLRPEGPRGQLTSPLTSKDTQSFQDYQQPTLIITPRYWGQPTCFSSKWDGSRPNTWRLSCTNLLGEDLSRRYLRRLSWTLGTNT